MDVKIFLSGNISFLRNKKKIPQWKLAVILDKSKGVVGSYERGELEPNITTIIKLSACFDVSIDQLILKDLKK